MDIACRNYEYDSRKKIITKDLPEFSFVEGLAICPFTDRIFVATGLFKSVFVLSETGDYLFSIRDNSRGLFTPWGICFLGNIICVTEYTNHSIVFMTYDGDIVSRAGENFQFLPNVLLTNPTRLTSYLNTEVFICDSGNKRLLHLFPDLPFCREIGRAELSRTEDVSIFNNSIYVLDWRSPCVAIFNMDGEFIKRMVNRGSTRFSDVSNPYCFTIDNYGNILFSDSGSDSIVVLSPSGKLIRKIGKRGEKEGEFEYPMGIAINSHSQIVSVNRRKKMGIQIF